MYGSIIEYNCPEGYGFDLPDRDTFSRKLLLKCEDWADWDPPYAIVCKGTVNFS